ncbi:type IV secretion system protein [Bartonella acomydis]
MKKIIISVVIAIVFGMQSTTLKAQENSISKNSSPTSIKSIEEKKRQRMKRQAEKRELVYLAREQLEILKKQLDYNIATHGSLVGSRHSDVKPRVNISTPYFHSPHLIYNKNKTSFSTNAISSVPTAGDIIVEQNLSFFPITQARTFIEKRKQYAAIVDKAISLQVFEETKNRFKMIEKALAEMKYMTDLKWVAELQAYTEGTIAVFQNEATKLQMVAHLRNAEQELIRQQKYKRNIRILNHQNSQMPAVQLQYARALQ